MASFRDSFNAGAGVAQTGIYAYDRAKTWADRLTEREAAKEAAARAREIEADRFEISRGDKKLEAEAADAKFQRTQAETERHNKAMESQYKPGSRGGSGRSLELSDYQREQLLAKANANYLEAIKQNNGAAVQMFGGLIEEYGGEVPAYEDKKFWPWQSHTPKYLPAEKGAVKAPAAGGAKSWKSYLPPPSATNK